MLALTQLFLLGAAHFFAIFFIAKYFEYILFSYQGLIVLFSVQLLSFFSNLWQPQISRYRHIAFLFFLSGIYFLSLAGLGSSIFWIVLSTIGIFVFIQTEIIRRLKTIPDIRVGYALELLGGLCGIFLHYFFSVHLGFPGFFAFSALILGFVLLTEFSKTKCFLGIMLLSLLSFFIKEPQPIVDKRDRYENLKKGRLLESYWNPNGHVELLETSILKDALLISFEGGALRSHISKFDGNYQRLRQDYLAGLSTGVWSLDVVLPHFLKPDSERVALISCVGGQELLAAKAFGGKIIDVVDINDSAQKIVADSTRAYNGNIYSGLVNVHTYDGRHFIKAADKNQYDIIQIYSAESASLSSALGSFFRPSSLFTAEALNDYVLRLKPDGVLQITINRVSRVKRTFEKAFGPEAFVGRNNFLVLRPADPREDLVSFVYKKDGWSSHDVERIVEWLHKDVSKKWTVLFDPVQSEQEKKNSIKRISGLNDNERPSTDNWPFIKLVSDPFKIPLFQNLVIAMFVLVALSLLSLRAKILPGLSKYGAFFMGCSYSLVQSIFILQLQKFIGRPGLGLALAVGWCLVLSGLASFIKIRKIKTWHFTAVVLACALAVPFSGAATFFLASALVFMQGTLFVGILKKSSAGLNQVFWYNGLGFSLGLVVFNLTFILLGFWQTNMVMLLSYLAVALYTTRQ